MSGSLKHVLFHKLTGMLTVLYRIKTTKLGLLYIFFMKMNIKVKELVFIWHQ